MRQHNLDLMLDAAIIQAPMREGAPVRRRSYRKGREGVFWRPTRRADLRVMYRAAERLELTARLAGKHNGPLGHIGLEVLRELMKMIDYKTGQLDPCLDTIAMRLRRARSAVIAAIKRLRAAGFIDWLRRYEETGDAGRRGPQVRQTSNAYRFVMPAFIGRLLGVFAHGQPLPEDEEDRRRDHRRMVERWEFEDTPLYGALETLRLKVEKAERESAMRSESPLEVNS